MYSRDERDILIADNHIYIYKNISAQCQSGFHNYVNRCYKYFHTPSTFKEASSKCAGLSDISFTYDLVSIHTPWENDFVKQLNGMTNGWQAWIGLKKENRMDWQNDTGDLIRNWTDGTKSKYQSWGPNEPSNINVVIDVSIHTRQHV